MAVRSILIIGAFNTGAIENFYVNGLKKSGIDISTYDIVNPYYSSAGKNIITRVVNKIIPDIFYKQVNQGLIEFVDKKNFDVILIFKGMELFPETIKLLKRHTVLLTNYNADHPFKFYSPGSGNSNVLKSIEYYDLHFSYAGKIVDQLKSRFNKNAYCIPFGYNSDINYFADNSFNEYTDKILFIGAYDKERASYLNKLTFRELYIYGDDNWKKRTWTKPNVKNAYRERKIYNNEYISAIRSSLGVINLLRQQNVIEGSHNMRTFEVPGYGGVLVSQRTGEQQEYFEEDKEAIFFDSLEELQDKLQYLRNTPSLVQKIKSNAERRSITSGYSYNDRSKQMLGIIEKYLI